MTRRSLLLAGKFSRATTLAESANRFAAEAWRRAESGELADEELYPCGSQWSGLYDRMTSHTPEETDRRTELATAFGQCADA